MSQIDDKAARGSCLCGEIQFEASGKPLWIAHCHCHSCRRNTGSLVATFVGYHNSQVKFVTGSRKFFNSSAGVQRGFCGNCGTPLTYEADRYQSEIHLYVCTLNEPENFKATAHVYNAERVSWFECDNELPRYSGSSSNSDSVEDKA